MTFRRVLGLLACLLGGLVMLPAAGAGEFDRVEGDRLAALVKDGAVTSRPGLTAGALEGLPQAFKDARSAFLVVKTGQGNYTRVLAAPAFRKPAGGEGPPIPVLLLERFDTFEPGRMSARLARGADVLLFDGFQLDLDTGQVVPEGQGGDLIFRAAGEGGPRVEPLGGAMLYVPTGPVTAGPVAAGPAQGKAVVPADFSGRYRLYADGRWSGLIELKAGDDRAVTGRFRSEPNGSSYPLQGEVSADVPNKVAFTVKFPRTEHEYEGFLWTEGKWAIAGTFRMRDRSFGFFAVREGKALD
jgi:hypothetical protein